MFIKLSEEFEININYPRVHKKIYQENVHKKYYQEYSNIL